LAKIHFVGQTKIEEKRKKENNLLKNTLILQCRKDKTTKQNRIITI